MKVKLPVLPGEEFYTLDDEHKLIDGIVPDYYEIYYGNYHFEPHGIFEYNGIEIDFSECFSNKKDFEKVYEGYKELRAAHPYLPITLTWAVKALGMVIEEKEFEVPGNLEGGDVILLDGKKLTIVSCVFIKDETGGVINYTALDEDNQYVPITDSDSFSKTGEKVDNKILEARTKDAIDKEEAKRRAKREAEQPKRNYDIDESEMFKVLSGIGSELKDIGSF